MRITRRKGKGNCSIMIIQLRIRGFLRMACPMERGLPRRRMGLSSRLNGWMALIYACFDFLYILFDSFDDLWMDFM